MPKPPSKIRSTLYALHSTLSPYLDIILFVVALFAADLVWKLCVSGDESMDTVSVLGMEATPWFNWISQSVAEQVYALVALFRDTVHLDGIHIYFDSGNGSRIVWSCTPVKQSWIWMCIILAARGRWVHKLWFIPAGWILIYGINLLRITAINLIVEFHPELFELMHTYVFKYAFYGCMFLMWLVWTTWFGCSNHTHIQPE